MSPQWTRSAGSALASTVASALPEKMESERSRRAAVFVAACASLALVSAVMVLSSAHYDSAIALKAKEDLSIFADSSVSFYEPGDTAADSDILPSEVLADDGSSTDKAESSRKVAMDYGDAHWYKAGQSEDVHGDLQEENRVREAKDKREGARQQQLREQEKMLWQQKEQANEIRAQQEAQLRQQRRAAVMQLSQQREARHARGRTESRESTPLSYKAMQQQMKQKDANIAKSALRDSYAYQHPFQSGKKGMQNLVMAEFKQDEHKMQATTDAIFGTKTTAHKWRHGGLLLSDASHPDTLHDAMRRQRAQEKVKEKARDQLLAQQPARGGKTGQQAVFHPKVVPLGCSIEQLENGGCSHMAAHKPNTHSKGEAHKVHAKKHDVVEPSAAPNAGTVISGWAKNVGSWF